MKAARVLVLSLACLVALASTAAAAMWLRIEVQGPIVVGREIPISVVTGVLRQGQCVGAAGAVFEPYSDWYVSSGDLDIRLETWRVSPTSDRVAIPLTRRASDPAHWDGRVRFDTTGDWVLKVYYPDFGNADAQECAGARRTVEVLPSAALPSTSTGRDPVGAATLALGSLVAITLGLLGLYALSRRPKAGSAA